MSDIVSFLIDLIFKPGSSLSLIPAINITILLLLLLMASLLYSTIPLYHIIIMSTLAVGLLLSVNWFYYEYSKVIAAEKEKDKSK